VGKLKKQLGLAGIFSIAAGAMISSGLFVLPAIAYAKAGPAVILSYLLASILIVPSVLSKAELATAMPRSGGTYFYVERSLGPVLGLFSGFANWFSVAMKSAFAIMGMAIFIEVFLSTAFGIKMNPVHLKAIGVLCCAVFTALNIFSVKHAARLQILLVAVLIGLLVSFAGWGSAVFEIKRYTGFLDKGWAAVFATAGLVFISYGGLTKVVSVAEEVRDAGKNLARGMILAWFVVSALYIWVIAVVLGVTEGAELAGSYTPISLAAGKLMGPTGYVLMGIAAVAAFVTTANSGILAASRCPMAMSRDKLLPGFLASINRRFHTPHISIILTGAFMIAAITTLDIETLVKTASTLMIILFILVNISIIVMRESRIQSYRPVFICPLYPYIHIAAIIVYGALIIDMGKVPLLICAGFVAFSGAWYFIYVRRNVSRQSALMHIVTRATARDLKTPTLENELRDILIERDDIIEDRFDKLVKRCEILDIEGTKSADEVFRQVSAILAKRLATDQQGLFEKFLQREAESGTVIEPGLAIPHIVVEGQNKFDILLVRAQDGVRWPQQQQPVKIMFVLVGSKDERNYHLRALMAIAQIAQEKHFHQQWLTAKGVEGIRNLVLLSTRKRDTNI